MLKKSYAWVVAARRACAKLIRAHAAQVGLQQLVGPRLDPSGHLGVRGAAVRGVVLEAAAVRRIVRGSDDDAVGKPARASAVVGENRMRDGGRRRVLIACRRHHFDAVGREHLECARECRRGQRVRVETDEQRPVDAALLAIAADRLGNREHVKFVEARFERLSRDGRRCRRPRVGRRRPGPGVRCSTR